jgi:hypothetical protein
MEFDEAAVVSEIASWSMSAATLGRGGSAGPSPNKASKKADALAAARKEAVLRAVLLQRRRHGYCADHLVAPICCGVFRAAQQSGHGDGHGGGGGGGSSDQTLLRLALEIVRGCSVAAEDESALAETIRSGIGSGGGSGGGAGRQHHIVAHFQLLMCAPPRLAAAVIWSDRSLIERYLGGGGGSGDDAQGDAADMGEDACAAAVTAIGRVLSRAGALTALSSAAPGGSDAVGACGAGACLAQSLWRRILSVVSGADNAPPLPPAVSGAAFNALALLIGRGQDTSFRVLG